MTTEPIERDIETLIDLQLRKLGWDDNPKSPNRKVWKQQPKKTDEKKNHGGLKPDYMYDLAEEGWKEKLGVLQTI